jgi:2-iminobutanoate/2-iminopropanoate deaminase
MNRKIITSTSAPKAIGPYSQAVKADKLLFISGQIPLDPSSGTITAIDIQSQTRQTLANLCAILKSEQLGPEDVVKVSIFLKDLNDFACVNDIYGQIFKTEPPARETIEVSRLPKDALLEISAIAVYRDAIREE